MKLDWQHFAIAVIVPAACAGTEAFLHGGFSLKSAGIAAIALGGTFIALAKQWANTPPGGS